METSLALLGSDVVIGVPPMEDGFVAIPNEPGLGVSIAPGAAEGRPPIQRPGHHAPAPRRLCRRPIARRATRRAVAAHALGAILRRGRTLDQALSAAPGLSALDSRDAAFARLLLLTTLRRLGQIDAFLAGLMDRPLPARRGAVQDVLRLGVCQLAFLETPAHAAVASTVALAHGSRLLPYRGLVNAVLRRASREHGAIAALDAPRLNTPDWLWNSWAEGYGEARCRAIAEAHLGEPRARPLAGRGRGRPGSRRCAPHSVRNVCRGARSGYAAPAR